MQKFYTRVVLSIVCCTSFLLATAQHSFFSAVNEATCKASNSKRVIVPSKYATLQLDTTSFLAFVQALPTEQALINKSLAPIIQIPMPNGTSANFRIWESATVAPELAAQFPLLKTYTGQGITDPTATIKLDWTEFGFHAMILSSVTGSYFIDPFDVQTKVNYISYFKTDFTKADKFLEVRPIKKNKKKGVIASTDNVQAGACVGVQLRTYRLAVACTHEYAIAATGLATPTVAQTLAKIVTTVNRVNGVYEKELSVRLVLIANNSLIVFPTAAGDPFTGNDAPNTLIDESQTVIDARIGNANYDIGHTFSTGGGGLAGLGVVCITGQKASGITGSTQPVGDPYDIDYVAHEMGHQFGGEHTFNSSNDFCGGNGSSTANSEPGSGTTIMAYAGICFPDNLQNNSDAYFNAISFDQITDYAVLGSGNGCAVRTATGNTAPVVNAGVDYNIPLSTPFILTGSATDANNDALTYCWEQINIGGPFGNWNAPAGDAPIFRSFTPVTTGTRFFPKLSDVRSNVTTIGEILPSYARLMNFRLTARDNKAGGGGVCRDEMAVQAVAGTGPFVVTYPNTSGIVWFVNDFQRVTWNVAGSDIGLVNCKNVSIQLSTDGGQTFPITLLATTSNDGAEDIIVPNNISSTVRIRVIAVGNIFYDMSNFNLTIQNPTAPSFSFNTPDVVAVCAANSGSTTLKTASLGSFNTPINLVATLNPAGTTVSFGTNPLAPGSSTTVTLNNTSSLAPGSYTVRITGTAGAVVKTRDIVFITGSGGSAPTTLSTPANSAIGVVIKPSFNWTAVSGALSYTLEISSNSSFSTIDQTINNITALPFTLTSPLNENTAYYWRVKSVNGCGTGLPTNTPNVFKTGLNSCRISNDVPKIISASGAPTITSTLVVPASLGVTITDVNVVGLDITHTFINDLSVSLRSPAGTTVVLFNGICNQEADFNLNLDQQAATTNFPCPPTGGGVVRPANSLAAFNGQSSTGTWTLTVADAADEDGGTLNGWGLSINTNSNACTFSSTPLATTYTFTGNGNWNVAANWSSGVIPPATLPANASIVINHTVGGNCILNVTQNIAQGANLTVVTGKNLLIPGTLNIQ
jgi:subtilisin-like proprotein convertase family protein